MILDDGEPLLVGLCPASAFHRDAVWRTLRCTASAWATANWVCSTSICCWREEMAPTHPYTGSLTLAFASYTMLLTASPLWCSGSSCQHVKQLVNQYIYKKVLNCGCSRNCSYITFITIEAITEKYGLCIIIVVIWLWKLLKSCCDSIAVVDLTLKLEYSYSIDRDDYIKKKKKY